MSLKFLNLSISHSHLIVFTYTFKKKIVTRRFKLINLFYELLKTDNFRIGMKQSYTQTDYGSSYHGIINRRFTAYDHLPSMRNSIFYLFILFCYSFFQIHGQARPQLCGDVCVSSLELGGDAWRAAHPSCLINYNLQYKLCNIYMYIYIMSKKQLFPELMSFLYFVS